MHIVVVLDPSRGEIREFSLGAIKQKVRAIWKKKKKTRIFYNILGFSNFLGGKCKKIKDFHNTRGGFQNLFYFVAGEWPTPIPNSILCLNLLKCLPLQVGFIKLHCKVHLLKIN